MRPDMRTYWQGGATVPTGYVPQTMTGNLRITSASSAYWVNYQIFGDPTLLVFQVIPPVQVTGFTPTESPIPTQYTPIKVPPGCRLQVYNTSGATTTAMFVIWPGQDWPDESKSQ